MAVTVSDTQVDGQYMLAGTARGSTALAPLGRWYKQVGAHWFGVDDRFADPVVVRAYYDPTLDTKARTELAKGAHGLPGSPGDRSVQHIGYMQFTAIEFLGVPIPPKEFGGRFAERQPYMAGKRFETLDFMGPSDAGARNIFMPYYPYNAMLTDTTITPLNSNVRFYQQPLTNGSLFCPSVIGTGQSLVASLAAEVSVGMVTKEQVDDALKGLAPVLVFTRSGDEALLEGYRAALTRLETEPLTGQTTAWLAGLDESKVTAQVIGDYVLLGLPDPEDLGDTVVVRTFPTSTDVEVYVISGYDAADLDAEAARDTLWRLKSYLLDNNLTPASRRDLDPPTGRGASGLNRAPYLLNAGPAIEIKYWSMPVSLRYGRHSRDLSTGTMLPGIQWSALLDYDEDTGLITVSAIREPVAADAFPLLPVLNRYNEARQELGGGSIDTSNFTKAAMKREQFTTAARLRFVDKDGRDVAAGQDD
ncbi:hypothetical protein [Yinghuangia seranimata]|uniref:hypothetical protein n=1 Tax=Yinghuangia seranimata TaxID=408067 RepID=UPI00248BC8D3|nr:hypothetical protein [Yinghuangia seranimata]MDI2124827.1 hypothetical protein [Yinghuangia seranimata]